MKKIISIIVSFLFLYTAHADTINSASKNSSVAVYGTQRTSTAIQPWIIPVATAGAACNSTTDIIAVTSDHSSQLVCQSGSWQPVGGGDISSKNNPGYAKLSSGIIIQWGTTYSTSVTFPIPFPNVCTTVNLNITNYYSSYPISGADLYVYPPSKTGVSFGSTGYGGLLRQWIAIGY